VRADPSRLKQILYNLLSNAIKFTPEEGRVSIAARTVETSIYRGGDYSALPIEELANRPPDQPKDIVEVSVTDSGIGIPAAHLDRIFEEFEQVEHPSAGGQEGTGLGLALVKKLVEMHGGTVRVASVPGEGSTFSFTIPLASD
jgi:signal transduction histidine kinase